jgi:hypothetical protein
MARSSTKTARATADHARRRTRQEPRLAASEISAPRRRADFTQQPPRTAARLPSTKRASERTGKQRGARRGSRSGVARNRLPARTPQRNYDECDVCHAPLRSPSRSPRRSGTPAFARRCIPQAYDAERSPRRAPRGATNERAAPQAKAASLRSRRCTRESRGLLEPAPQQHQRVVLQLRHSPPRSR